MVGQSRWCTSAPSNTLLTLPRSRSTSYDGDSPLPTDENGVPATLVASWSKSNVSTPGVTRIVSSSW